MDDSSNHLLRDDDPALEGTNESSEASLRLVLFVCAFMVLGLLAGLVLFRLTGCELGLRSC